MCHEKVDTRAPPFMWQTRPLLLLLCPFRPVDRRRSVRVRRVHSPCFSCVHGRAPPPEMPPAASTTIASALHRSTCLRKRSPRPFPLCAPGTSPGTSTSVTGGPPSACARERYRLCVQWGRPVAKHHGPAWTLGQACSARVEVPTKVWDRLGGTERRFYPVRIPRTEEILVRGDV